MAWNIFQSNTLMALVSTMKQKMCQLWHPVPTSPDVELDLFFITSHVAVDCRAVSGRAQYKMWLFIKYFLNPARASQASSSESHLWFWSSDVTSSSSSPFLFWVRQSHVMVDDLVPPTHWAACRAPAVPRRRAGPGVVRVMGRGGSGKTLFILILKR